MAFYSLINLADHFKEPDLVGLIWIAHSVGRIAGQLDLKLEVIPLFMACKYDQ